MSTDPKHPDLVGFVAGLHAPAEETAIAAHIDGCIECRSEADTLRSLRRSLRAGPDHHVSIEDLVAHDEGVLDGQPGSRSVIEAHVARCRDCRSDLESLARARRARDDAAWGPRRVAPVEPVPAASRRRSIARTAAAAAILVLAGAGLVIAPWRNPVSPTLPSPRRSVTFMPPKRGGLADRSLFAGERLSLRVVLPYEASDGPYLARIEREDGSVVDRPVTTPTGGETLTIDVEAPAETGAYRLVLVPEDRSNEGTVVYPFLIQATRAAPRAGGG
jgi:hypothetical protein